MGPFVKFLDELVSIAGLFIYQQEDGSAHVTPSRPTAPSRSKTPESLTAPGMGAMSQTVQMFVVFVSISPAAGLGLVHSFSSHTRSLSIKTYNDTSV